MLEHLTIFAHSSSHQSYLIWNTITSMTYAETKSWILVSERETDLTARSPTFYMGVSTVQYIFLPMCEMSEFFFFHTTDFIVGRSFPMNMTLTQFIKPSYRLCYWNLFSSNLKVRKLDFGRVCFSKSKTLKTKTNNLFRDLKRSCPTVKSSIVD